MQTNCVIGSGEHMEPAAHFANQVVSQRSY
jgi:hypothetical protein